MLKPLAFALALVLAAPAAALGATPRDNLVVSTAWLAENLSNPDVVILQIGDGPGYQAGHIPGARLVNLPDIAAPPSGDPPLTLQMPEPAALHAKLVSLGVTDRSKIVVVHGRTEIQSATRAVFTLDAAGLGERTVFLDGGLAAWTRENRPVTTEAPVIRTGALAPLRMRPLVVDADFVRSKINTPGTAIVDARAPNFYSGEAQGGGAGGRHKAGHVVSAKSVPFSIVTTPDLKLASPEVLAARFAEAGVKPGDTVIAYCHVGQQATAAIFAARTLGYDVRLYDGSFEDWSRRDLPVETSVKAP